MYQRILVGVDGSDAAQQALQEALALAKVHQAEVRAVYVLDSSQQVMTFGIVEAQPLINVLRDTGKKILEQVAEAARGQGASIETHLAETMGETGHTAETLVAAAKDWKADLIVVGTHGRRGLRRMLIGSVAETVVRMAELPVLLVHKPAKA